MAPTTVVFLVAELVWFRLSSPILGGSTYSYGIVLAVALLGIGLGGTLFALWGRPVASHFTMTCGLEGLFLMVPFAMGDGLAIFAAHLRSLVIEGFPILVLTWVLVTSKPHSCSVISATFRVETPCTHISATANFRARSLRSPRSNAEG